MTNVMGQERGTRSLETALTSEELRKIDAY
jgi:hypothetical protein